MIISFLIVLVMNIIVLYLFTVLLPSQLKLRQGLVLFVAECITEYRDFYDDVMTVVMVKDSNGTRQSPKDQFNGLLDDWFNKNMPVAI